MTLIPFFAGLFLGGMIGAVVMAICAASGRAAREERARAEAAGWLP